MPWWKPLEAETAFKAKLFRCNQCQILLERKTWPAGVFFRLASIVAAAVIGGAAVYHGYKAIPYSAWGPVGVAIGILPETFEDIYSRRPAYIAVDEMQAAVQ